MKRILVVTRSFPPVENTAALRPAGWARHLHKFGLFPIFLTCCQHKSEEGTEFYDHYIVQRVATGKSFFRQLSDDNKQATLKKIYSFLDVILDNSFRYSSIKNLMPVAETILVKHAVCACIISGPPFSLFNIGNKLRASHNIPWIADYRDDWTTNEETHFIVQIRNFFEKKREIRLLNNASHFFAVSEFQLKKIKSLINCNGSVVANGFEKLEGSKSIGQPNRVKLGIDDNKLNIAYTGTIYDSQKLDFLLDVLESLDSYELNKIRFIFVGSDIKKLAKNKRLSKHRDKTILVVPRVNKISADEILQSCDLGLYIAYTKRNGNLIKGIPSSKLYEYMKFAKPVIFVPSDDDIAYHTMSKIGLAEGSSSVSDCVHTLKNLLAEKLMNKKIVRNIDKSELSRHLAEEKTFALAQVLEKFTNE